jgi:lactate dehydrogenase-like 2-hydroxyacid dehydrogenase
VVREGRWRDDERMRPRPSLKGRKVGIVGLGAIGEAVARRVVAFGMSVAWWGPNPKPSEWPRAASLLALAEDSDILVVCARAEAANRGLISAEVIDAVGPGGMIVNVARGQLIDEDALIAALKAGRLGRAGLDVFAEEPTPASRWADVPNTVLTPHTAGGTTDSIPRMVAQALENIRLHLAGEAVMSPV